MSISRAVQHFKYVCMVSRDTIPAQAEIGKNDWVPDRMAARGCYGGGTYVRCMCSGYMPFNFRIMDVTRCVIPGIESANMLLLPLQQLTVCLEVEQIHSGAAVGLRLSGYGSGLREVGRFHLCIKHLLVHCSHLSC